MNSFATVLASLLTMCSCGPALIDDPPATRQVIVNVRAQASPTEPLGGVAFRISTEVEHKVVVTQLDGTASVPIQAKTGTDARVYLEPHVSLFAGGGVDPKDWKEKIQPKVGRMLRKYAAPKSASGVIAANAEMLELVWQVAPGARPLKLKISSVYDLDGLTNVLHCELRDTAWKGSGIPGEGLLLEGSAWGKLQQMFVSTTSPRILPVVIPAEKAVATGTPDAPSPLEINLPLMPREAKVDFTFTHHKDCVGYEFLPCGAVITLVRSDGAYVLHYGVNHLGKGISMPRGTVNGQPDTSCWMPAGTYYLSMGCVPDRYPLALYDMVVAGRLAELDAAGVVKFTVTANQTLELSVDAPQALAAVRTAAGL